MSIDLRIGLVLAVAAFLYVGYAMLRPERF
ncbi:MAG: potassium-transporting ATPase subunit F [Vulcanimicrobiaceae bacterium]